MNSQSQDYRARRDGQLKSKFPIVLPETPKNCLNHERLNQTVMPGWMKFALLALAIVGFIIATAVLH